MARDADSSAGTEGESTRGGEGEGCGRVPTVYVLTNGRWGASVEAGDEEGAVVGDEDHHSIPLSSPAVSIPPSDQRCNGDGVGGDAGFGSGYDAVALTTAVEWYEYYARRYPSIGRMELMEKRTRLEEARKRRGPQSVKGMTKRGVGWLRWLLFGDSQGDAAEEDIDGAADGSKNVTIGGENLDIFDDENSITSTDGEYEPESFADVREGMCGSARPLDKDAVTHEAVAFHRFHLVSERRALICCAASATATARDRWNVILAVRTGEGCGLSDLGGEVPHYCIVGYGKIAEFPLLESSQSYTRKEVDGCKGNGGMHDEPMVSLTSDYQHLLSLADGDIDVAQGPPHDLRHARAACIGEDCLIVSWGRGDGWIVFYRKIRHIALAKQQVGWEVIAAASPSKAVLHAATNNMTPNSWHNFNVERHEGGQEEDGDELLDRRLYDSGSLFVTDLLPLVIENDSVNCQSHQRQQAVPSSVILAVSRLGGYVELLPLPRWVWAPRDANIQPPPPPKEQFLPNLTATSHITAFATHQHHLDVMALDAYRTGVGGGKEWDERVRMEGSPAEFILAACGRPSPQDDSNGDRDDGMYKKATVTLWGVTVIHPLLDQQQRQQQQSDPLLDVRVRRLDHLSLDNLGADVSLFLSDAAADCWIGLPDHFGGQIDGRRSKRHKMSSHSCGVRSCTITNVAPLVSLRFTPRTDVNGVLLAALDFNGGVSVLECTRTVRSAEQLNVPYDGSAPDGYQKLRLLCDRQTMMPIFSKKEKKSWRMAAAHTRQTEWWKPSPSAGRSGDNGFTLASYVTLTQCQRNGTLKSTGLMRLQRWASSLDRGPVDVISLPVSSHAAQPLPAALLLTPPHGRESISFIKISALPNNSTGRADPLPPTLSIVALRTFDDPGSIISALLRRGDPTRALEVARKIGGLRHFGGWVMNQCHVRLWEDNRDVAALKMVEDDEYVIRQALGLLQLGGGGDGSVELKGLNLNGLLEIFEEGLGRSDGLEQDKSRGTDGIASTISSRLLRNGLRHLGTFRLLLSHYAVTAKSDDDWQDNLISHSENPLLARRFLHEFWKGSQLSFIASCAAARGDVGALTMLSARHPTVFSSMRERMRLLDLIPADVDFGSYRHLLPCHVANGVAGIDKNVYFWSRSGEGADFLNALELFTRLAELQLHRGRTIDGKLEEVGSVIEVYTDGADRDRIRLHFWEGADNVDFGPSATIGIRGPNNASGSGNDPTSRDEVATWYLHSAIDLHDATGQTFLTRSVCEAGLIRLGFVASMRDGDRGCEDWLDLNNVPESCGRYEGAVGRLIYLHSAASLLCHILVDKLKESVLSEWKEILVSIIQFCSMDISTVLLFMLEGGGDTCNSVAAFRRHLARYGDGGSHKCLNPIEATTGGTCIKPSKDLFSRLQYQMMELCLDRLKQMRREKNLGMSPAVLQCASPPYSLRLSEYLSACADFASSVGIHGWHQHDLIDFMESMLRSILEVGKGELDLFTEDVMDTLWSTFELLPYTVLENLRQESVLASIQEINHKRVVGIRFKLVVIQLCCKWHDGRIIPEKLWNFLHDRVVGGDEGSSAHDEWARDLCMAGHSIISIICSGFAKTIVGPDTEVDCTLEHDFDLLLDFVVDVDEFDKRFFSSGVQWSGCLGKYLFSPLLFQHSFVMLRNILKVRPAWFCQDFVNSVVLSFTRDIAISGGSGLHIMLACWEILGPSFPSLRAKLDRQRYILNAKQFMSESMELDSLLLGQVFSVECSANPIVLVEALMNIIPQVILVGCEFWKDKLSSSKACTDALSYFSSQLCVLLNSGGTAAEKSHVLPPMPGALVMQLANLLGLCTPQKLLLVKRCMAEGALKLSLGPAAVAICYSMLCDAAFSRRGHVICDAKWTSQHDLLLLHCVITVISDQSFDMVHEKKGMCAWALWLISAWDVALYRVTLETFKDLEYQLLTLETDNISPGAPTGAGQLSGEIGKGGTQSAQHLDFLVFKAAGLVAKQARGFVDHSETTRNPSAITCGNSFHNETMSHIYHDIKQSSPADLLQLLSSTGRLPSQSNESSLRAICKVTFNWIVSEVFKARRNTPSPLPTANILLMMKLGSSCLAELLANDVASQIIDQTLEGFKVKASMLSAQQNSPSLDHSIQPDISIVRRLHDRGYGWNVARRAVIMTNNQSYSAALTWAVSHFQDDHVDSPITFLHDDSSTCVYHHWILVVGKLLQSVQQNIEVKRVFVDADISDPANRSVEKFPLTERKHDITGFSDSVASSASPKSSNNIISTKKHFVPKISSPSPLSFHDGDKHWVNSDVGNCRGRTAPVGAKHTHAATYVVKKTFECKLPSLSSTPPTSAFTTLVGDKHSISTPTNVIKTNQQLISNSGDSISSVEGSLSSHASIKKQVKIGRTKLGTQKLSFEERKKLALEGKRLLDATRARNKQVIAPPTSITTSNHVPL